MNNTSKHKCVGSVVLIPCESIDPNPFHSRKIFNSESFEDLIVSVKKNGIIQPLLVKKVYNRYQIISGERRLRAAVLSGLIYVPCIIINISDIMLAGFSIIENLQYDNIHFFDEALSFVDIMNRFNISAIQLSNAIGKSEKYINNKISLLNLDIEIRKKIIENSLSEEYANTLLRIKDRNMQGQMLDSFLNSNSSVNENDNSTTSLMSSVSVNNKRIFKFNNIKLFINTFNHTVDTMQKAGIEVISEQYESENFLEYVVRIPKMTTSPVILSEYVGSA